MENNEYIVPTIYNEVDKPIVMLKVPAELYKRVNALKFINILRTEFDGNDYSIVGASNIVPRSGVYGILLDNSDDYFILFDSEMDKKFDVNALMYAKSIGLLYIDDVIYKSILGKIYAVNKENING